MNLTNSFVWYHKTIYGNYDPSSEAIACVCVCVYLFPNSSKTVVSNDKGISTPMIESMTLKTIRLSYHISKHFGVQGLMLNLFIACNFLKWIKKSYQIFQIKRSITIQKYLSIVRFW